MCSSDLGLGVGFTSRFALDRQRALGTLAPVKVKGLRITREFSMVHPRGPMTNSVAGIFAAHLTAFAREVETRRAKGRSDKKS